MYDTVINYILMFFLFSMLGWTVESTYRSLGEGRVINSGFLYGPLCPIYGTGGLVFSILLVPIREPAEKRWWLVILIGVIAADAVEYLTSFLMEKLFHARWWDYSHEFLNINGRICFKHTCYWAIFAIMYSYFISPIYEYMISFMPQSVRAGCVYIIFVVFTLDLILTVKAALNVQKLVDKINSLKLNLAMATEFVKYTADNIKNSTEIKYKELQDTMAQNSEKFEEWRSDVKKQIKSITEQINEIGNKKSAISPRREKRLISVSQGLKTKTTKLLKELEEKWDEFSGKNS